MIPMRRAHSGVFSRAVQYLSGSLVMVSVSTRSTFTFGRTQPTIDFTHTTRRWRLRAVQVPGLHRRTKATLEDNAMKSRRNLIGLTGISLLLAIICNLAPSALGCDSA